MNLTRKIILATALLTMTAGTSLAVTDKEMEQARTIAAQAYLRYANDGSGYLDDVKATTMTQLESRLKKTEKENLAAFKAAARPGDYSGWTKEQLVEYWSDTFFRSPGLTEKGKMAKARIRKRISAMNIAIPDPVHTSANETEPADVQKKQPDTSPATDTASSAATRPILAADSLAQAADQLAAAREELQEAESGTEKGNTMTWVYIIILGVLVGIVVWLVIFASRVMKKENNKPRRVYDEEDDHVATAADLRARASVSQSEIARLRGEIDRITAEKDTEIATLRSRCEQAAFEASRLRAELTDARSRLAAAQATRHHTADSDQTPPTSTAPAENNQTRTIYLGRVNTRGLFVRADRGLTLGHSIFRLDTTDGYSGTFRVANNPKVWSMAMLDPGESLRGGCVAENLLDTTGKTRIVTESAGTAIFEDGCWKVIRPTRIRYE